MRRMLSETLYDSIVTAGHLFEREAQSRQELKTSWTVSRRQAERRPPGLGSDGRSSRAEDGDESPRDRRGRGSRTGHMSKRGSNSTSAKSSPKPKRMTRSKSTKCASCRRKKSKPSGCVRRCATTPRRRLHRPLREGDDRRQPGSQLVAPHGLAGRSRTLPASLRPDRPASAGRVSRPRSLDATGPDDAQRPMTHEASRVGDLEPMYSTLVEKKDLDERRSRWPIAKS